MRSRADPVGGVVRLGAGQGGMTKSRAEMGTPVDSVEAMGEVSQQAAELDAALQGEWLRLSAGLRRAVAAATELDAGADQVAALASEAEALAERLEAAAPGRGVSLFGQQEGDDLNAVLRFSPIMGRLNPVAPPLEVQQVGDRVRGRVTLGPAYQGSHGLVHGAVIAAIYDDLLASANIARGQTGPTAKLTIRYRRPTPLRRELRLEAWVERIAGRRIHTRGRCWDGDELLTDAEGLFVYFEPEAYGETWGRPGLDGEGI
jgi:acyl-coenzyme A thioesterase PaaI-like protein